MRQVSGSLTGAHQVAEHRIEGLRIVFQCLREAAATFDSFHYAGDHFPETRVLGGITQIGQAFEDGHAGAGQLLQVEAEVDEFAPWRRCRPEQCAVADRLSVDEIEFHAP